MRIFKIVLTTLFFTVISFFIVFLVFKPILISDTVIFSFAVHPFNICEEQPVIWSIIKFLFVFDYLFSNLIIFYSIFSRLFPRKIKQKVITTENPDELNLKIGFNHLNNLISIPEKSLYQNILITGTIGSRKNIFCYVSIY